MTTIACAIIGSPGREQLVEDVVLPSVVPQNFDEVLLIGPGRSGDGYRHLPVADVTRSTLDALQKRDVATAASHSAWVVYLSNDHRLAPNFVTNLRIWLDRPHTHDTDIIVPHRFCIREGTLIPLPMGAPSYCAGHAGVFSRRALREVPFSIAPRVPPWDVYHSQMLTARGYTLKYTDIVAIEDVEPGATPWQ